MGLLVTLKQRRWFGLGKRVTRGFPDAIGWATDKQSKDGTTIIVSGELFIYKKYEDRNVTIVSYSPGSWYSVEQA